MAAEDDAQEAARVAAVTGLARTMQALRAQDTLSLHSLAEKSSVDRKVLRGLEAGSLNPSLKTLDKLANAFGVSVAQLLGGPGAVTASPLGSSALVALNVKRLRHSRNWSTSDLEARIRMKAAYVSFIETGRGGCTLLTLTRLAAGFDVGIAALFLLPAKRIPSTKLGTGCTTNRKTSEVRKKPLGAPEAPGASAEPDI